MTAHTTHTRHALQLAAAALAAIVTIAPLSACGSSSSSTSALQEVKNKGTLVFGTEGTYAPYSYHDSKTNKLTGYDVEVATAVAKDLGVKAEFSEANFDSLLASVDSKKTDSVANEITVTAERKAKYDFTEPYAYSYGVVVTRKNDNSIKSFDDIKGKKDAGQNGSNWAKVAQDKGATLVQVNDFSQAVETLTSGRADVIVNDGLAVLDYLKQKPNADIKIAVKSEKTPAAHFPLRKGSDDLTQAINKSIAKLRKDGTLKKISEKYFGEDISSK